MLPSSKKVFTSILCLSIVAVLPLHAQITGGDVNRAVDRGLNFLRQAQQGNGSWPYSAPQYEPGLTALAVMALLNAGVPKHDKSVQNGVRYILRKGATYTYSVGLVIIVLAEVDHVRYRAVIKKYTDWLARSQGRDGTWTYNHRQNFAGGGDNSNTQFAVLGLHWARRAGIPIGKKVWDRVIDHFKSTQNKDGGWGYSGVNASRTSMSAAGTASLLIAGDSLYNATKTCGRYKHGKQAAAGVSYLSKHWGAGGGHNSYYTTYALERVGILSGQKFIGRRDWYKELATSLVRSQGAGGSWGAGNNPSTVVNTCFALLTLAKGKAPVLVNKLKWDGHWNNDRNDMKNLSEYASKQFGKKVTWQVMDSTAKLEEWMTAPLLYMNGHTWPRLNAKEVEQLKEFVDRGGILFAESCCGRAAFDAGFRDIIKKAWPGRKLTMLSQEHEVFRSYFRISQRKARIEGLNLGCRTGILYTRRDISCDLEKRDTSRGAFKVGINIAAYAMGETPLKDKLEKIVLKPRRKADEKASDDLVPRGALTIGQIKHSGDWDTDPISIRRLQAYMRKQLNVTVTADRMPIPLTSSELPNFPILYITGHRDFSFNDEERENLKQFLTRGGFLFADACCGRKSFDKAFRREMGLAFPDKPLHPLPVGHTIYSSGFQLKQVKYKKAVLKEKANFTTPHLEGVTHEGRAIVIYSPYDLGCSIEDHVCPQCRGLTPDDAHKVAANIVIYALGY